MKKQFLLILALVTFGFVSAQDKTEMLAEAVPAKEIKSEVDKTEKKAKKEKADRKAKKADRKKTVATTPKRYYIDSSGQKRYVE